MFSTYVNECALLPPKSPPKSLPKEIQLTTESQQREVNLVPEPDLNLWRNISAPANITYQEIEKVKAEVEEEQKKRKVLNKQIDQEIRNNFIGSKQNPWRSLLLISGSDVILHGYLENIIEPEADQSEQTSESPMFLNIDKDIIKYLPELEGIQYGCCILSIDIKYYKNYRFISFGCQDGTVTLIVSELIANKQEEDDTIQYVRIKFVTSTYLDGPISSVKLVSNVVGCLHDYPIRTKPKKFHHLFKEFEKNENIHIQDTIINLLVCSPTGYAVIFKDCLQYLLSNSTLLPNSDCFDSVNCCTIVQQFSFDYIVLGTYSGTLLFYSCKNDNITLQYTRNVMFPVVNIECCNLQITGVCTLVVNSTSGIHFFELSNNFVEAIICEKLKYFEECAVLEKRINILKGSDEKTTDAFDSANDD